MKYIDFNINHYFKVKLTDKAFEYWKQSDDNILPERYRHDIDHYKSQQDKDGYTLFQAWSFMQIFGNSIVFGGKQLFDTNILIQVDDKV